MMSNRDTHFMIFCCEFRGIRSKKFAEPEFLSTFAIPFGETSSKGQFFNRNKRILKFIFSQCKEDK